MKKRIPCMLLALLFTLLLGGNALAAGNEVDTSQGTFTVAEEKQGTITITPGTDGSGNPLDGKVNVTCTGLTPNQQYLVLMVTDPNNISEKTIQYIDQGQANEDGSITFAVYPTVVTDGVILICGQDAGGTGNPRLEAVIVKGKYMLGDLTGDKKINIADAIRALRFAMSIDTPTDTQRLAGDVNGDGKINTLDAIQILRRAMSIITSFN